MNNSACVNACVIQKCVCVCAHACEGQERDGQERDGQERDGQERDGILTTQVPCIHGSDAHSLVSFMQLKPVYPGAHIQL